jgi:hypothetical protein
MSTYVLDTKSVLDKIQDEIKESLNKFAAEEGKRLKAIFDDSIDKKVRELTFKAAQSITSFASMRQIDRDSVEIRIVIQEKSL